MKKLKIVIATTFLLSSILAQTTKIKLGIDVLRDNNFEILTGKKIGLVTNATGVDSKLKSTIDILNEAENVELVALYGPEHGVRGDHPAGDYVEFYVDENTKLPVYSLYGKTRKPSEEMLKDVDVLVYDIQDIGSRSYTYISTMGLVMEAAAKYGKEVVVLDRPNPLGGLKVEGCLVEEGYISFVSQFKIPYVYGLTCGELAKMLNEEDMLENGAKCNLTVIPMEGWKREMAFEETGLEWVMTSPHIPHKHSGFFYAISGIAGELSSLSIGVGYTLPFQVFATEYINAEELAKRMNALNLPGVIFRPISFKQFYAAMKDKFLHGVQIHIPEFDKVNLTEIQFYFMQVHHEMYPDKNLFELAKDRWSMFDKVCGSNFIREEFSKQFVYDDIKGYWEKDVDSFRELSKKYYLYE